MKFHSRASLVYTILLIGIPIYILGQSSIAYNPPYKHYTSEDGLPSSEVHEAVQDRDGYMWFGTDNGLSRFDGYTFKNYGYQDGLLHQVIFGLMIDKKGELWILTSNGHIYIKDSKNNFRPYKYNHLITQYEDEYYNTNIFDFNKDESELYVALNENGILKVDTNGNETLIVPNHPGTIAIDSAGIQLHSRYFNENVNPIEKQKKFILQGKTHPITIILDTARITFDITLKNTLAGSNYLRISKDLHYYRNGGYFGFIDQNKIIKDNLLAEHFSVNFMYNNELYIGLYSRKGVYIYKNIEDFPFHVSTKILGGNTISDFHEDKSGGLWVLTIDNGIYYLPFGEMEVYSEISGLASGNISSFDFKNDSTILLALWDDGLVELDLRKNSIVNIPKTTIQEPYYYYVMYNASDTSILGGSRLQIFKNKNWKIMHHPFRNDCFTIKKVSSRSFNSRIAIFGHVHLFIYNQKNNTLENISSNYSNEYQNSANYDEWGTLWYGPNIGLYKYENRVSTKIEDDHPVFNIRIEDIDFLSNGNIVLGTKGLGVAIWNRIDSIQEINNTHGLSADNIENVYVDSLDQIWVGTLNGLNKISINDGSIKVKQINIKHGLPGNEITQVRRRNSKMYIATTKGLAIMDDILEHRESIKPIFSNVTNNEKNIDISANTSFLHTENNFIFEYVAINYRADGDITYRYRMDNSKEWKETKNTTLNFSSLSPAKYQLEIQAQNEDGYWSKSLEYQFSIAFPFWRTWWFYSLAAILIVLGGYVYYKNRLKAISEKQAVKDQLNSLERSALRAQMNPHFIFNILNSIQSAILQNNQEFATSLLSKFAKLIRTTLNNARENSIPLEDEIEYLNSYLYMESVRFKNKFEYKITVQDNIDIIELQMPPMLIQPLVENAIKHGLKNSKKNKGNIDINFSKLKGELIVSVRDNGPGLKEKEILRTHKSLGMKITSERLRLLNTEADDDQNLTVENRFDTSGQIIGAQARISIKLEV